MYNQLLMITDKPFLAFVISLTVGVFIVFAVWILAHAGEIIRNFIEAIKQDRSIKP